MVNNWFSGYCYYYYVENNAGSRAVTDPSQAVKSMATYSNPYFGTLWQAVIDDPDQNDPNYFGSNTTVVT